MPPHPESGSGTRSESADNRTLRTPGRVYVLVMFYHWPRLSATANGGPGRTGISLLDHIHAACSILATSAARFGVVIGFSSRHCPRPMRYLVVAGTLLSAGQLGQVPGDWRLRGTAPGWAILAGGTGSARRGQGLAQVPAPNPSRTMGAN